MRRVDEQDCQDITYVLLVTREALIGEHTLKPLLTVQKH